MHLQVDYEEILIKKLRKLPSTYLKVILDFIEFLTSKAEKNETLFLSETSLAKDWLLPEEDEAWKDL